MQLSLEEKLLQDAQRRAAARLSREQAAGLLGAAPGALDVALRGQDLPDGPDGSRAGLRLDQAAALSWALTADQVAVVVTGPAGSGKTRLLAAGARAWTAAGKGPVVGIATAQAARNVLAEAGVGVAENSAVFLGHLPGRRGARGIRDLSPGTLVLIDEASMTSLPDLADIVGQAARCGAKVIIAGDQEQLAAVEAGGGMALLARRLGYVQLAEAVRFTAPWERDASLRLRAGDASALDEYYQHGRIRGAEPELALDDAAARYVAHHLAGRDVLLMIRDNERCREVSRRIRDDLIHLGLVDGAGPDVGLAHGARASAGDLIICRRNDRRVTAGEPGRTLANGDTLRIEQVRADGVIIVRRAIDCDPVTGRRRWAARPFVWSGYRTADLAYAVTGHAAQGRTVAGGLAVLTGTEDRQWMYVAMSRGTEFNTAIVFTRPPGVADPREGTRPAPELARHARIERQRAGHLVAADPVALAIGGPDGKPGLPAARAAIGVVADVAGADGSQVSALETQERALSNADHLAALNAIWQGETAGLTADRYRQVVLRELPQHAGGLDTPHASWLWRTLRAAEAAGLDAGQVVRDAVRSRSLTGTRDVAAVIDFRIRQVTDPLVPLPPPRWSDRVPQAAEPEQQEFLTGLAAAMDARKERIGEHLSEHPPSWAERALGPVPGDPLDRLDWQRRASDLGAYRELYGYDHPDEPIGPEPAGDSPDKRAAWHAAFAAMAPGDGTDLRALPDGDLLNLRGAYETETAWAPRHVGRELAQIRASADDAGLGAIRARAEEQAARRRGQGDAVGRHAALARSFSAMEAFYQQQETELDQTMRARRDWEQATEQARRLAVASDAELRRRHPDQRLTPLRSAEPMVTGAERDQLILAAGADRYETPDWITRLAAERQAVRAQLRDRQNSPVGTPRGGPELDGVSWSGADGPHRDAILQPPRPPIRPSAAVTERAARPDPVPDPQAEAG